RREPADDRQVRVDGAGLPGPGHARARHQREGLEGHPRRVRPPLRDRRAPRRSQRLIEREFEIKNKLGLHARAAAKLVHVAARFSSDIKIRKGDEEVDGKSILGILLLAAGRGTIITIKANGDDEAEAVEAIEKLIDAKFDEVE